VLFGSRSGAATALSESQRRLLAAVVRGKTAEAIAAELGTVERDVETEVQRAFRALGVDNRIDALYELASRGVQLG
jgi:DNA-binding NarL/FixJ family response regulator